MTRKELPILGNPYPSYIRQCTSHVAPNTYLIIVSLILWSNQKLRFIMTYYCILIVDRIKFKKSADYYDRLLYSYCWLSKIKKITVHHDGLLYSYCW